MHITYSVLLFNMSTWHSDETEIIHLI